jgi:hypothetical protein
MLIALFRKNLAVGNGKYRADEPAELAAEPGGVEVVRASRNDS